MRLFSKIRVNNLLQFKNFRNFQKFQRILSAPFFMSGGRARTPLHYLKAEDQTRKRVPSLGSPDY